MFDEDLITINPDGSITYKDELEEQHIIFIDTVTTVKMLPPEILTEQFLEYLALRNSWNYVQGDKKQLAFIERVIKLIEWYLFFGHHMK